MRHAVMQICICRRLSVIINFMYPKIGVLEENRDIYIIQEYFYTKFSTFIYHICLQKSVYIYSINLIFGEMAQHQSQCSIFANQQLKVSNIFLCSGCFRPTATVPLLTHAHQPVYILLSLSKTFNPFPEILQQLFGTQNQVSAMLIDPSFIFVRYFTHNPSYRPNCDYDLKY